ncbi:hypothetical protein M8J77_003267 [Diaphorina citri]|nr:hypothetical protein M8J77_003267 [Diaphorina citri]
MESEHFVLIFGITCASLAIGAYVLFGPNFTSKKKTPVLGLQNLGQTCFMNTILQALGSCPIFIIWLDSQSETLGEVGQALRKILQKLGQVAPQDSQEYAIQPLEFMSVLSQHGWQMNLYNNIQQDAHELLTFILSKIEDEIFLNVKNQRNGLGWIDKDKSLLGDKLNESPSLNTSLVSLNGSVATLGSSGDPGNTIKPRRKPLSLNNTNVQSNCASSFRGRLVSQIRCAVCGHENPLKYDNFDSLSLHLPQRSTLGQTHSLTGLLEDFVDTEIINEFECEMCNKDRLRNSTVSNDLNSVEDSSSENGGNPTPGSLGNQTSQGIPTRPAKVLCDAVRTLRLGKLPPCLCLHIHRTFYSSHGAYKRQDYVDFPEYLVMDPYTYNAVLREKEVKKKLVTQLNGAFPHDVSLDYRSARPSNVYRLKAVVVHRGSAEDGHFVTYRRGPIRSLSRYRWYFASDADIRESSLAQALKSVAYMLFYERCSPTLIDVQSETTSGDSMPDVAPTSTRLTNGHCVT